MDATAGAPVQRGVLTMLAKGLGIMVAILLVAVCVATWAIMSLIDINRDQGLNIIELEGELVDCQAATASCLDFTGAGCDKRLQKQITEINVKLDTIGHKLMRDKVADQLRIKR